MTAPRVVDLGPVAPHEAADRARQALAGHWAARRPAPMPSSPHDGTAPRPPAGPWTLEVSPALPEEPPLWGAVPRVAWFAAAHRPGFPEVSDGLRVLPDVGRVRRVDGSLVLEATGWSEGQAVVRGIRPVSPTEAAGLAGLPAAEAGLLAGGGGHHVDVEAAYRAWWATSAGRFALPDAVVAAVSTWLRLSLP